MLLYPVAAEGFALAFGAAFPLPYGIDMVGGGIDQRRLVGQYACLEVAVAVTLHADTRAGELGRANIGRGAVEYHYLEMHSRT